MRWKEEEGHAGEYERELQVLKIYWQGDAKGFDMMNASLNHTFRHCANDA
jgi:hypothetical protein